MQRSATSSFYNPDALGSITSLANAGGTLGQTYTFDSFGKQTASNGSLTSPFRYTGREFDSETGLLYLRARYYSPEVGRFVSEDPIQFNGGINFYSYVRNAPTGQVDPYGLSPADVQTILTMFYNYVNQLVANHERLPGSGELSGYWNNFVSTVTLGASASGCTRQADLTASYLQFPGRPYHYDDHWDFTVISIKHGFHHVVQAKPKNPNDPILLLDPWANESTFFPPPEKGCACEQGVK
jgi:RHS repeat-associated protein